MEKIDTALQRRLDSLGKSLKERGARNEKANSAEVVQLPLWPEPTRGVPNAILRGALFAGVQGKHRKYMKRALLAVQKGVEIRFTGMQLDQSDLDVWEQALHLARQHPLGTRCDFTAHAFLKALGRATGKANHEWLKDVLARLAGAVVEITHNDQTYFGPLIEGGARDEKTGLYMLALNPKLVKLYSAGMWTAVDWKQRLFLRRKPLALWLHGFLASHAEPYPLKLQSLMGWSGSKTKQVWKFKQNLKAALNELHDLGAITGYEFDGDLVKIGRTPTGSQQRHLFKR